MIINSPQKPLKPITYHDEIVGWVIVSAADKISNEADISFDKQQLRTSWIIAGLTVLFALLITVNTVTQHDPPSKAISGGNP